MIYVITEDNRSGKDFWISVSHAFKNLEVTSSGGCGGMYASYMQRLVELKSGDIILLALDSASTEHVVKQNKGSIMKLHKEMLLAKRNGVSVTLLNYYCFEEVMLTFSKLAMWACYSPRSPLNLEPIQEYLVGCISNDIDYFENPSPELKDFIRLMNSKNREYLCSHLLGHLTHKTGFRVTKSELGECWRCNCCDNESAWAKHKCKMHECKMTLQDKLLEFNDNSDFKLYFDLRQLDVT